MRLALLFIRDGAPEVAEDVVEEAAAPAAVPVVVAVVVERSVLLQLAADFELPLLLLFLRQPPPTGTLLRAPPRVQYLLQVLQKCLG